ncbi:hypothetical protein [Mucilaginibacter antarcticus]|uniref:Uncharacterized protein n=1 Tax=Mucilaginibacter antarcticus TaxID=1855725 RepID=A0ABW5XSV6_9SPHI
MLHPDDDLQGTPDSQSALDKPNAYRVDNDDEAEGTEPADQANPVREGQPMGGHSFGENNTTPAGDDKNNPSQNAGYRNEYFRRTEPSEEHTESNNFKPGEDQNYNEGTTDSDG